jgi:hypothetical protein
MATRKRQAPGQVVRKLSQTDRMLGRSRMSPGVCRDLGVSEQTSYRWRNEFGGLRVSDAERLKDLEKENAKQQSASAGSNRPDLSLPPRGRASHPEISKA